MKQKSRLTQFSSGAGWACKLSPEDLSQVLRNLKISSSKNTLIDYNPLGLFDDGLKENIDWFNNNWDKIRETADFPIGMCALVPKIIGIFVLVPIIKPLPALTNNSVYPPIATPYLDVVLASECAVK